jgi:hypothetical protein
MALLYSGVNSYHGVLEVPLSVSCSPSLHLPPSPCVSPPLAAFLFAMSPGTKVRLCRKVCHTRKLARESFASYSEGVDSDELHRRSDTTARQRRGKASRPSGSRCRRLESPLVYAALTYIELALVSAFSPCSTTSTDSSDTLLNPLNGGCVRVFVQKRTVTWV